MINNGKSTIEKTPEGLYLEIPSKKNWFALIFGTIWLGGWFFGFAGAAGMLSLSSTGEVFANGFLSIWLIGWTLGGLFIIVLLLWGFFGLERLIINRNEILFEKTIFGLGQKKRMEISAIKNFRTSFVDSDWMGKNRWAFWGLGPGRIKFDYGMKTYSLGLGVDDAEASYIVEQLKEQFKEP